MVQLLWETVWQFVTKLNMFLPYDPAVIPLGIYPKELKTYAKAKASSRIFIASLLITSRIWKQLICPSVNEWINNCPIQTIECYSMLKRNELSSYEKTWRNLKCTTLSKNINLKRLCTV